MNRRKDIFGREPWDEDDEQADPLEPFIDYAAMRHVPLEIRRRLRPEYQHWGVVDERLWPPYQRSDECRKVFLETSRGAIMELDHLQGAVREAGDRVWCLARRRPRRRGGGAPGWRAPVLTEPEWLARNPRLVIDWGEEVPAPMRRFALEVRVLHLPGEWDGGEWTWRLDAWGGHLPHVREIGGTAAEGEWVHVARFDGLESVARHTLTVQRGGRAMTLVNHLDEAGLRRAGAVRQPGAADPPLWLLRHEVREDTVVLTVSPRPPRFGVFFDGTGNHLYRDLRDPDDEHEPTNVGKLHELYPHRKQSIVQRWYIPGVGTGPGGEDRLVDQGFAFSFGKRIANAVTALENFLTNFPLCPVAEVDVFGFSRGAAQARAFVNEVLRLTREDPGRWGGPAPRFSFLGLFDTVGSVGLPGDGDDHNWLAGGGLEGEIVLDVAPESVARAHQVTAEDELRRYFPLTSLREPDGSLPGHFSEEGLPGAHADIGGGYGPVARTIYVGRAVVTWYTEAQRQAAIEAERARLAAARPLPGLELEWEREHLEEAPPGRMQALVRRAPGARVPEAAGDGVLRVEQGVFRWRREVPPDYACLALHRMHAVAVEAGVPLAEVEALDEKGFRWQVPPEVPGWVEWVQEKGRAGQVWAWLYTRYLHHSHQYVAPPGEVVNPHEPEPSGRRTVYFNRPGRARAAWARAPAQEREA